MSKYHPLDVRHPSNRDRERNNYLLAPPDANSYALRGAAVRTQAPSRRSADYRSATGAAVGAPVTATTVSVPPAQAAAPWGSTDRNSPASGPTPSTRSRSPSWVPRLVFFAIFAFVILRSFGVWDQIVLFVTRTAYDLGLR